jgi:hypothetical protein
MRRIFWGFCRNWVLIDPLHYLSSRSAFGFEFAEIFLIEKRLFDSASPGIDDTPTRRVRESAFECLKEKLGKSESRPLPDSANRGVANSLTRRGGESSTPGPISAKTPENPPRCHVPLSERALSCTWIRSWGWKKKVARVPQERGLSKNRHKKFCPLEQRNVSSMKTIVLN